MQNPTLTEQALLAPPGRLIELIVGTICLALGGGLTLLTLALARALVLASRWPTTSEFTIVVSIVVLSIFFIVAGARLSFTRANEMGSLFPSWVWFLISGLLIACTPFILYIAIVKPSFDTGRAVASALLLALLAYGAGKHFQNKLRAPRGEA